MKKQNLVDINLHGCLGEHLKRKTFKWAGKTLGHCLNAVEILSGRRLYKFLLENDKKGIKYKILINGRQFISEKPIDQNDIDSIKNSELNMCIDNLKTIDIIPVLEGAGVTPTGLLFGEEVEALVAGIILIIIGVILLFVPGFQLLGGALILGGLALVAAGVINLLSQPPTLDNIKERQKSSYLFDGPTNTITEGANVPVGYGTLIIGSVPISASYDIDDFDSGHRPNENVNKNN